MKNLVQKYKRIANLLVIFAFLINASIPALGTIARSSSTSDTSYEAMLGGKILICTPSGYQYVSIEDIGNKKTPNQTGKLSHCPLCAIELASPHFLASTDVDTYIPSRIARTLSFDTETIFLPRGKTFQKFSPRAPPYA
jgi:hypothetical protein